MNIWLKPHRYGGVVDRAVRSACLRGDMLGFTNSDCCRARLPTQHVHPETYTSCYRVETGRDHRDQKFDRQKEPHRAMLQHAPLHKNLALQ
jgi:hypothetical protein